MSGTERDSDGRLRSVSSEEQPIRGPLGIWPFPILNFIAQGQGSSTVTVTEVNRDGDGRVTSIEEFEL